MHKLLMVLFALSLCIPAMGQSGSINFDVRGGSDNDDYITIPYDASLDLTGQFTVAMWLNFDVLPSTGCGSWYFNNWSTSGTDRTQAVGCIQTTASDVFRVQAYDGSVIGVNSTIAPSVGTWHFVAFGYDNSNIWIIAVGEESRQTTSAAGKTWDSKSPDPTQLGDSSKATYDFGFDGQMAYVHVYKGKSLSDDELAQIKYCPGSVTGSLSLYLPMWDSDTQYDLSSNDNDGTDGVAISTSTTGPPIQQCGLGQGN